MESLFKGNTALKGMRTEYGDTVLSEMLAQICVPEQLISTSAYYTQKAQVATDPTLIGMYKAKARKAEAMLDALLDMGVQATGAKVILDVPEKIIYGAPTQDEALELSAMAKEATATGTGAKIVETGHAEKKGRTIDFNSRKEIIVEEKSEVPADAEQTAISFPEQSADNNPANSTPEQGNAEANGKSKEKKVLPITRIPSLGTGMLPEKVIKAITSINELDAYFREQAKELEKDVNVRANAYLDAVEAAAAFTDMPGESLARMKENEFSTYQRFMNMCENFRPRVSNKNTSGKERITYNQTITNAIALLQTSTIEEFKKYLDRQLRHEGVLDDAKGFVMPHMPITEVEKLSASLIAEHGKKDVVTETATAPEASIEDKKKLTAEALAENVDAQALEYGKRQWVYEDLVEELNKILTDEKNTHRKYLAFRVADAAALGKVLKKRDGKETEMFTSDKCASLVELLIHPDTRVNVLNGVRIVEDTNRIAVENYLQEHPEVAPAIEKAIAENPDKELRPGMVAKIIRAINPDIAKEKPNFLSKLYKYLKNKTEVPVVDAQTSIKEETAPAAEEAGEIFVRTKEVSTIIADALKGITSIETLQEDCIRLLNSGAKWQEVLNGVYATIPNIEDDTIKNWSESTIDIWFDNISKAANTVAITEFEKPANVDPTTEKEQPAATPVIEDATIVSETVIDKSTLVKAKDQKELNATIKSLLEQGKRDEAEAHAQLFFPKHKLGKIKDYVNKYDKK